jgi:hypothetical protein
MAFVEGLLQPTAPEVRNMRAQLRRMSEPQGMDSQNVSKERNQRRVDTEHRGVTGTAPRGSFLIRRHPHSD